MITAFSQFIQRRYINPLENEEAHKDFKFVIDGAKRMSTLIKDMREYTRWSAQSLPVETVNVREVLLETKQNLTVSINLSNAVIRAANLPVIQVNRLMLVQVFQNLISNAIKYRHPMRQPEIEISVIKLEKEWLFKFEDNGIGFEDKHKERIFGIFQRLNNDRITGNGIGLAICKRIIAKQGGKIWAESVAGEGSIFSFSIPIWDQNDLFTEEMMFQDLLEEPMLVDKY
jgi:light-regulated signal transduction histidine kinase (bacteriophytochrome)